MHADERDGDDSAACERADGADAEQAVDALAALIANKFGER